MTESYSSQSEKIAQPSLDGIHKLSTIKKYFGALALGTGVLLSTSHMLRAADSAPQEKNHIQQSQPPKDNFDFKHNVTRIMVKGCTQDGIPLTGQFHIIPNAADFSLLSTKEQHKFSILSAYTLSSIWDQSLKVINVQKLIHDHSIDTMQKYSTRSPIGRDEYMKRKFYHILHNGPLKELQNFIKEQFNVRVMTSAEKIDAVLTYDTESKTMNKCNPEQSSGEIIAAERDTQKGVRTYDLRPETTASL